MYLLQARLLIGKKRILTGGCSPAALRDRMVR